MGLGGKLLFVLIAIAFAVLVYASDAYADDDDGFGDAIDQLLDDMANEDGLGIGTSHFGEDPPVANGGSGTSLMKLYTLAEIDQFIYVRVYTVWHCGSLFNSCSQHYPGV